MENYRGERVFSIMGRTIQIQRPGLDTDQPEPVRNTSLTICDQRTVLNITEINAQPSDLGSTVAARSVETVRTASNLNRP